jgi:predicted transcriptional regulator
MRKGFFMTTQTKIEPTVKTFEQAETLLQELHEKALERRREFEGLRAQAERMVRDIATANEKADAQLELYRDELHDGRKKEADEALDSVSKYREEAKALNGVLAKLLAEIDPLKKAVEDVRLGGTAIFESKIFPDIEYRLKLAYGLIGRVADSCGHTGLELNNLRDFIERHTKKPE